MVVRDAIASGQITKGRIVKLSIAVRDALVVAISAMAAVQHCPHDPRLRIQRLLRELRFAGRESSCCALAADSSTEKLVFLYC